MTFDGKAWSTPFGRPLVNRAIVTETNKRVNVYQFHAYNP
jgi:hypothetical protein